PQSMSEYVTSPPHVTCGDNPMSHWDTWVRLELTPACVSAEFADVTGSRVSSARVASKTDHPTSAARTARLCRFRAAQLLQKAPSQTPAEFTTAQSQHCSPSEPLTQHPCRKVQPHVRSMRWFRLPGTSPARANATRPTTTPTEVPTHPTDFRL